MKSGSNLVHWIVWGLLAMVIAAIAGVFFSSQLRQAQRPLPIYGDIPDFKLTNQLGQAVSLADFRGQVWIADIIFTRCSGPCPDMTLKMRAVEEGLPPGSPVKLVSLTADPDYDSPAVFREYATRFGIQTNRWSLLTGPKQAVYNLAINGFKLAVQQQASDGKPDPDQFIHSTRFVIVDQRGRLRGVSFEGASAVKEILQAVRQLLNEAS
jgi:protein SCO1/2